jgi:hypothetical protein
MSQVGKFLMTPEQHRRAAAALRELDPEDGVLEMLDAVKLARHHENLAKLIERRQKKLSNR